MSQSIFNIDYRWIKKFRESLSAEIKSDKKAHVFSIDEYLSLDRYKGQIGSAISKISTKPSRELETSARNQLIEYILLFSQFEYYVSAEQTEHVSSTLKIDSAIADIIHQKIRQLIALHHMVYDNDMIVAHLLSKACSVLNHIIILVSEQLSQFTQAINNLDLPGVEKTFLSSMQSFNAETVVIQAGELNKEIDCIQRKHQEKAFQNNLKQIAEILVKYAIVSESILFDFNTVKSTSMESNFLSAYPSAVFDSLLYKVAAAEMKPEDTQTLIYLLINTPKLKTHTIHPPLQYALTLLIALVASFINKATTTTSSSSSDTSTQTSSSSLLLSDELCLELMLLLHTRKAQEFMLLFHIYDRLLPKSHERTTFFQNLLCNRLDEYAKTIAKIKFKRIISFDVNKDVGLVLHKISQAFKSLSNKNYSHLTKTLGHYCDMMQYKYAPERLSIEKISDETAVVSNSSHAIAAPADSLERISMSFQHMLILQEAAAAWHSPDIRKSSVQDAVARLLPDTTYLSSSPSRFPSSPSHLSSSLSGLPISQSSRTSLFLRNSQYRYTSEVETNYFEQWLETLNRWINHNTLHDEQGKMVIDSIEVQQFIKVIIETLLYMAASLHWPWDERANPLTSALMFCIILKNRTNSFQLDESSVTMLKDAIAILTGTSQLTLTIKFVNMLKELQDVMPDLFEIRQSMITKISPSLFELSPVPTRIYLKMREILFEQGIDALTRIDPITHQAPLYEVIDNFCIETLKLIAIYCQTYAESTFMLCTTPIDAYGYTVLDVAIARSLNLVDMDDPLSQSATRELVISLDTQLLCYELLLRFGANPERKPPAGLSAIEHLNAQDNDISIKILAILAPIPLDASIPAQSDSSHSHSGPSSSSQVLAPLPTLPDQASTKNEPPGCRIS